MCHYAETNVQMFAPNRVVCLDATRGTNIYDFQLITLMIVDEYREGFPVAWCLSNRTDETALIVYFKSLQEQVKTIVPSWLMSDDAEQFYTSWVYVFGPGPRKLLCSWHVDRAWRGQLNLIKCKEAQAEVYHILRILLEETDIQRFETFLQGALTKFNSNETTTAFGTYFSRMYARRKEEWATCYRKAALVNTNMHVEAFHRTLRYQYLMGKVNKPVDKCIHTLLKFARDKAFDRLVKLEKGKLTERIQMIIKDTELVGSLTQTL